MSLKLVPYTEEVFAKLFEWQNDEEIRKVAKEHAEIHMVENLLMVKNEESIEAFLSGVQNWCKSAGFSLSIRDKNDSTNYTLMHKQGTKFSILVEETIKTSIEILTREKARVKHTTNVVSFWI